MNSIQWMAKQVFAPLEARPTDEELSLRALSPIRRKEVLKKVFTPEFIAELRDRLEVQGQSKVAVLKQMGISDTTMTILMRKHKIEYTYSGKGVKNRIIMKRKHDDTSTET